MDKKLLEILVCPQCKGSLNVVDGGRGIFCAACQLKYPVRDGVPVMLVDEALGVSGARASHGDLSMRSHLVSFKVIGGPNEGLSFQLEKQTCKAIGRSIDDPNKTQMFQVEVNLSLDESTKNLVQKYIQRQFKKQGLADAQRTKSSFKRTSDVILDDMAISRLHCMLFHNAAGVGILDMVSKNGTFVNGEEIESRLLRKGDTLEIGETKIIFEG